MFILKAATSNLERQREFRKRNPGYFKRYNRKYTGKDTESLNAERAAIEAEQRRQWEMPASWLASA